MNVTYLETGLVIVVEESVARAARGPRDMRVVSSRDKRQCHNAIDEAFKLSVNNHDKTYTVITWSMDCGTQPEYTVEAGIPLPYVPCIQREYPQRWSAAIVETVARHLDTICRSQIPVEAPPGFKVDVGHDADTVDAIESPFVGEVK